MEIVFLDAFTTNTQGDVSFEPITSLGHCTFYDRTAPTEVIERCIEADIIITNKVVIDNEILSQLPQLKYIVVAATGFNNIDIQAAKSRQIPVSNVRGYSTDSVVQQVFASLLAVLNKPQYYDQAVKQGRWESSLDFCFLDHSIPSISSMTLGLIGLGAIGQKIKQVGEAFGMSVLTVSSRNFMRNDEKYTPLDVVLGQSDIISLHCPLNHNTKQMVNVEFINKMKAGSILINTARGPILDDSAILQALNSGHLSHVILDVLQTEPPNKDHLLLHHENCFVTPHIAWANKSARQKLIDGIAHNISSFKAGRVENVVY